jgi:hypothetical protein
MAWLVLAVVSQQPDVPTPAASPVDAPPVETAPPAETTPAPTAQAAPQGLMAVMPILSPDSSTSADALDLLSGVLSAQLAELGGAKVLSPDELRALLATESTRQGLGAVDDGALAEIAAASGAELVVTGRVNRVAGLMRWEAELVNTRLSSTLHHGTLTGRNVQALAARGDEMALLLLGKKQETGVKASAAKRLGFNSKEDLRGFVDYRKQHPEWGTTEALTQYIIANNVEENRLALSEAGVFLAGAALSVHSVLFAMGAMFAYTSTPLPFLVAPFCVGATGCCFAGAGTMAVAVGLAIWDGLDRTFRPVKKKGCCRDDAIIHDAVARSALRRTAALGILLGGPAALMVSFVLLTTYAIGSTAVSAYLAVAGLPQFATDISRPGAVLGGSLVTPAYACGVCSCLLPCAVGLPMGAALLFWPDRAPVQEVDQ